MTKKILSEKSYIQYLTSMRARYEVFFPVGHMHPNLNTPEWRKYGAHYIKWKTSEEGKAEIERVKETVLARHRLSLSVTAANLKWMRNIFQHPLYELWKDMTEKQGFCEVSPTTLALPSGIITVESEHDLRILAILMRANERLKSKSFNNK